jgi:DNA-binding FadR family transcriptional regulator
MFNGLRAAYEPTLPTLAELLRQEVERHDAYRAVVVAVRAGDPDLAAAAANDLLEPGTTAVLSAIDHLLAEEDDK